MWTFLKEALGGFVSHGAILPSSPFLTDRMIHPLEMKEGMCVVELGAGTGAFTQELLARMPQNSRLVVIELNPVLAKHLKEKISDSRVTIIEGDATQLSSFLNELNISKADYIVSGLPIGNFKYSVRQQVLSEIHKNLHDDGRYIQFQYFLASLRHIRRLFDARIVAYELRNMPPAFVYECKKRPI